MEVEKTVALPTDKLKELETLVNETVITPENLKSIQLQGDSLIQSLKKQFRLILANPISSKASNPEEFEFVFQVLEYSALFTLKTQRTKEFIRTYKQLAPFYRATKSQNKWLMVGLNLLCTLAAQDISGFHTELELIPSDVKSENVYIRYAVNLEQSLMEGRYSNVLKLTSSDTVPSKWYSYVLLSMKDAIRNDIAGCIEAAYTTLAVDVTMKFLLFEENQKSEFEKYVLEKAWTVDGGKIVFEDAKKKNAAGSVSLSSGKLVRDSVAYSNELEKIV